MFSSLKALPQQDIQLHFKPFERKLCKVPLQHHIIFFFIFHDGKRKLKFKSAYRAFTAVRRCSSPSTSSLFVCYCRSRKSEGENMSTACVGLINRFYWLLLCKLLMNVGLSSNNSFWRDVVNKSSESASQLLHLRTGLIVSLSYSTGTTTTMGRKSSKASEVVERRSVKRLIAAGVHSNWSRFRKSLEWNHNNFHLRQVFHPERSEAFNGFSIWFHSPMRFRNRKFNNNFRSLPFSLLSKNTKSDWKIRVGLRVMVVRECAHPRSSTSR